MSASASDHAIGPGAPGPYLECPWCGSPGQRQPVTSPMVWTRRPARPAATCERCRFVEVYTAE